MYSDQVTANRKGIKCNVYCPCILARKYELDLLSHFVNLVENDVEVLKSLSTYLCVH